MYRNFVQRTITATLKLAFRAEAMGMSTRIIIPTIQNTQPVAHVMASQVQWHAIKSSISDVKLIIKPVDLSKAIGNVSSVAYTCMDAFTQAQKEKEARAEYMVGPLVREVIRKKGELQSLSKPEQAEIKEQFLAAKTVHKIHKRQIRDTNVAVGFFQQAVDAELAAVLKSRIDPQTLHKFCNALKTSSRVTTQVVPTLRILNNLSLAYDVAKILYPDEVNEIERYVITALEAHKETLEQGFADTTQRFKRALQEGRDEPLNPEAPEKPQAISDQKEDSPPSLKK